jgi:hypothetical protein
MAHHGNAALGEKRHRLRHSLPSLKLDGAALRFLQDPHRGMKCLFLRSFIGAERHVDHDQGMLRAAHHRPALQDHHLERHRHRGLETVHDIAEGVADQDDVAMPVDQRRGMGVVGGQHHDGLAALASEDVRRGLAPDRSLYRHVQAPMTGTPITAGWKAKASAR